IHVRLLHQLQELPRISGKRFHVAPLTFGVDGIERERAFTRAGEPSDHNQLAARQIDVDALQIVLAGAAHADMSKAIAHAGRPMAIEVMEMPTASSRLNSKGCSASPLAP